MKLTTRERIIQHAIHCVASNPRISLEEIAEAANVSRATIYRHFRSREDLTVSMHIFAGEQLSREVDLILDYHLPIIEKLKMLVNKLVPLGSSMNVTSYFDKKTHEKHPEVRHLYDKHVAQAHRLSLELKSENIVDPSIPLAWLISSLENLIFGAWESVQAGDIAAKDAPHLVIRTFLNGLGTTENTIQQTQL